MNTHKALVAGLALASLLSASVASAQVASTTAVLPTGTADLAVAIGGSGITLDATQSALPIQVSSLPLSISGAPGGTCTINNAGAAVGTVGTGSTVTFTNPVTIAAGQSVTLPVTCTGSTPGTYNVSMVTSVIPAIVANSSRSITPRGIGGGSNNDTVAVGTLTIGSSGTGSVTGPGTTTSSSGTGAVLGTSTGTPNLPTSNTSGTGSVLGTSTGTPSVPNTGDGGAMAMNLAILALAGTLAVGGAWALRRLSATR